MYPKTSDTVSDFTKTDTRSWHCAARNQPFQHAHPNAIGFCSNCNAFLCPSAVLFLVDQWITAAID